MNWVIFDYGNVLSLPQSESDADAMALASGADPAAFKHAYWEYRLDFDRDALSDEDYWEKTVGRPLEDGELERLIALDVESWSRPDEGAVAVLEELLARGRNVALLSNAPVCMADGLDELPWIAAIERRFYSGRMGLVKPDAEIYEAVVGDLGGDAGDMVFVDDRLENIQAAERAGLKGHHYTGAAGLREMIEKLSLM
ncbi:HAD family hydrolase [Nonomuraea sp. NPDC050556]|uniref:HAD family hydrolase n=1 Tax=Nonomuraea sp. NPDC050556 TaxID=3364369 RepID=UPI0037B0CB7C